MSPEISQEDHPKWEGAIVGFLFAIDQGLVQHKEIIIKTPEVVSELMLMDALDDLGQLQTYLRKSGASVQLVAQPFKPENLPDGVLCIDPISEETRGHYMLVCIGGVMQSADNEVRKRLDDLSMSNEVNETTLTRDTGLLVMG